MLLVAKKLERKVAELGLEHLEHHEVVVARPGLLHQACITSAISPSMPSGLQKLNSSR